jgi:hypothetical protein
MALHMNFSHPDQIEALKSKEKRSRENQLNLRRIAAGATGPRASRRIAPYGLNRPHEVIDFPYLAHNGPKDESPTEKCISIVTGDRVPEKYEKDYIRHREYAEGCSADVFKLLGVTPIHFDVYALDARDGVHEWRGRGAFDSSFVWDMKRFPDRFGRIGAALAQRGLYVDLDIARDCNAKLNAEGKFEGFRSFGVDYGASNSTNPGPLICGQSLKIQWQRSSWGKWIKKNIVLHDGDLLQGGMGPRYADRVARFSKLLATDYQPEMIAVYDNRVSVKGGTQFYARGKDGLFYGHGRCVGNAFNGDKGGFELDGFGELPHGLTAEQLAFIDCRLAASGLEMLLVPTEGEDIDYDGLSLAWDVQVEEGVDFG